MAVRRSAHRRFDLEALSDGEWLVGIDEAGRGCLAGPVMAGAVAVHRSFYESKWCRRVGCRVDDSKKLTVEEREDLYQGLVDLASEGGAFWSAAFATVEEIATFNILGATRLAMRRAVENAVHAISDCLTLPQIGCEDSLFLLASQPPNARLLIDGKPMRPFPYAHQGIVGGDARSLAIGMASIIAKVTRDRMMVTLHDEDPRYGYDSHKGYCTPQHCAAILEHGPTSHHRALFLRKLLAGDTAIPEQDHLELAELNA